DWWGWAATLVFAATGRPPFGRGPMDVVLARVRAGEFDLAGVDPRLEPLLAAALSPHPGDRPPADLVLAALERYAAGAAATDVFPAGGAGAAWAGAGGASGAGPAGGAARPSSPSTRVMPVAGLAGAVEPARSPMPQPAPAPPHDWRREQWQPGEWEPAPAWPAEPQWVGQPLRGPAGGVGLSGPAGAHDPAATRHTSAGFGEPGAVEVDPRIGRPDRTGPLTALAGLFVALVAVAPVIGVAAAVLWSWVARVADRSVTSLVLRRFENGRRRSDLPVTVAMAPVHVLGGAFAAVLAGALPLLVGGAGMLCVALAMSASGRPSSPIAGPLGLAVGMVLAIVTGWWGPGGASLRRGSKSLARGFAPTGGMVADVVVGVLVVAALAVVGWGVVRGWVPLWWPLPGAPSWVR
ncbi:MAG TPA: serine/threonine protein kinase, partial [Dermatophilaceae bacterium]|nr:serine/threonine protein kinase [Dermatophilaceae bacterium]